MAAKSQYSGMDITQRAPRYAEVEVPCDLLCDGWVRGMGRKRRGMALQIVFVFFFFFRVYFI